MIGNNSIDQIFIADHVDDLEASLSSPAFPPVPSISIEENDRLLRNQWNREAEASICDQLDENPGKAFYDSGTILCFEVNE
jgi:hypothetical protein